MIHRRNLTQDLDIAKKEKSFDKNSILSNNTKKSMPYGPSE